MGKVGCRPSKSAKQRLRAKLKKLTRRNRSGTFKDVVKDINQVTVGWINYYKNSYVKTFLIETQSWLHRRLRQLIWKRWKKVSTRYKQLKKRGINPIDSFKMASSRKAYWRCSRSEILHRALSNKKFVQWGLKDLITLYEQ